MILRPLWYSIVLSVLALATAAQQPRRVRYNISTNRTVNIKDALRVRGKSEDEIEEIIARRNEALDLRRRQEAMSQEEKWRLAEIRIAERGYLGGSGGAGARIIFSPEHVQRLREKHGVTNAIPPRPSRNLPEATP